MSLTIELLPAQEQQIQAEAERTGVSVSEILRNLIAARFPVANTNAHRQNPEETLLIDGERAEEERLFAQLHANMNETRQSLGMRRI